MELTGEFRHVLHSSGMFKGSHLKLQVEVLDEFQSNLDCLDPKNGSLYKRWVDAEPQHLVKLNLKSGGSV